MNYTIEQAIKWNKAKRIIVSTDSEEFARIAKEAGGDVPFLRPQELAGDTASKGKAIKHALIECERIYKEQYDVVVDLDVTAPVRKLQDMDNCLDIFLKDNPKTLFSVVVAHKNPYFNMVEEKDGKILLCKSFGKDINRRQDAPPVYAMNASIYFYRRDYVLNSEDPSPFSDDMKIYVMEDIAGIDIDREIDFKFVEFLMKEGAVKI